MVYQKTLHRKIEIQGIGLHSGKPIKLELIPAEAGFGVVFKRVDLSNAPTISALAPNIHSTDLNTTIGTNEARVATIEHLMAAFVGLVWTTCW